MEETPGMQLFIRRFAPPAVIPDFGTRCIRHIHHKKGIKERPIANSRKLLSYE
jgi:hypothetical protein